MTVAIGITNVYCRHEDLYSFELKPGVAWNYHCDTCGRHWYRTSAISGAQLWLAEQRALARNEREVGEYWEIGRQISHREDQLTWNDPVAQRAQVFLDRNLNNVYRLIKADRES